MHVATLSSKFFRTTVECNRGRRLSFVETQINNTTQFADFVKKSVCWANNVATYGTCLLASCEIMTGVLLGLFKESLHMLSLTMPFTFISRYILQNHIATVSHAHRANMICTAPLLGAASAHFLIDLLIALLAHHYFSCNPCEEGARARNTDALMGNTYFQHICHPLNLLGHRVGGMRFGCSANSFFIL